MSPEQDADDEDLDADDEDLDEDGEPDVQWYPLSMFPPRVAAILQAMNDEDEAIGAEEVNAV